MNDKYWKPYDSIKIDEPSDWECHLFGGYGSEGLVWTPLKGKVPNWFWRKMQYLLVGNMWIKQPKKKK